MAWFWSDIDWTATGTITAAWVQAVGSIAAVAGASWVGVYQAREARKLALEQDHQREAERLLERARSLEAAGAIARWASSRLRELAGVLSDAGQAREASRYLPHVGQQFNGYQARAMALGFAQIPQSGRELVFALEHFLSSASGSASRAVDDLGGSTTDSAVICQNLSNDFQVLERNIGGLAEDLAKASREVSAAATARG
jgi:hypothetical protein